jgi:hypothetical protein
MLRKLLLGFPTIGLAAGLAAGSPANAQVALTPANPFMVNATAPGGGLWLPSTDGGHLWVADHLFGLCRVDVIGGTASIVQSTCQAGLDGQPAFDSVHNLVYGADGSRQSQGISRFKYNPAGLLGKGQLTNRTTILTGLGTNRPLAVALGKNNSTILNNQNNRLFVVTKRSANIWRANLTFNAPVAPATVGTPNAVNGLTVIAATAQKGTATGLAFLNGSLFLADGADVNEIPAAGTCATPCDGPSPVGTGILPQALVTDGKYLYADDLDTVNRILVDPVDGLLSVELYASPFVTPGFLAERFMTGLAVKPAVPATLTTAAIPGNLFAGGDRAGLGDPLAAHWYVMDLLSP